MMIQRTKIILTQAIKELRKAQHRQQPTSLAQKKIEKVLQSKIKMKSFGILLGLIATIHITSSVPVVPEENKGMRITT